MCCLRLSAVQAALVPAGTASRHGKPQRQYECHLMEHWRIGVISFISPAAFGMIERVTHCRFIPMPRMLMIKFATDLIDQYDLLPRFPPPINPPCTGSRGGGLQRLK
jgi:hypothetical protein